MAELPVVVLSLGADMSNSVVDRVAFDKTDLSNVKFRNAVITGATFVGANLDGASFDDALIGGEDAKRLYVPHSPPIPFKPPCVPESNHRNTHFCSSFITASVFCVTYCSCLIRVPMRFWGFLSQDRDVLVAHVHIR